MYSYEKIMKCIYCLRILIFVMLFLQYNIIQTPHATTLQQCINDKKANQNHTSITSLHYNTHVSSEFIPVTLLALSSHTSNFRILLLKTSEPLQQIRAGTSQSHMLPTASTTFPGNSTAERCGGPRSPPLRNSARFLMHYLSQLRFN